MKRSKKVASTELNARKKIRAIANYLLKLWFFERFFGCGSSVH